jgi:hypothetical protein
MPTGFDSENSLDDRPPVWPSDNFWIADHLGIIGDPLGGLFSSAEGHFRLARYVRTIVRARSTVLISSECRRRVVTNAPPDSIS